MDQKIPLNSIWDDRPQDYEEIRKCWLNERRADYILHSLPEHPSKNRVLELGSGTGWLLRRLAELAPHINFVGLEPQEKYVDHANAAAKSEGILNVHFIKGMAEDLSKSLKAEPPFDLILTNDVLHHIFDLQTVCKEAVRVVSRPARWLAIEPNWKNPYTFFRQATGKGERNFFPRPFLETCLEFGWRKKSIDHIFIIPPFLKEPSDFLKKVERRLEGNPFITGGVALELTNGC